MVIGERWQNHRKPIDSNCALGKNMNYEKMTVATHSMFYYSFKR